MATIHGMGLFDPRSRHNLDGENGTARIVKPADPEKVKAHREKINALKKGRKV